MNKKRFLAVLAAATMLISTVPVYAESTGSGTNTQVVTGSGTGVTGQAVTGTGTVNDVDKSARYVVTLPTGKALDFIVDPHGLVSLESTSDSVTIDPDATGAGAILAAENALAVIKNQSNVDVKVTVNLQVLDGTGTNDLILETAQSNVATSTGQSMFIAMVPSATMADDADSYTATKQAIAIASGGTNVYFRLDASDYEVIKNTNGTFTYQLEGSDDNYDATAFKIGGSVSKQADWTDYAGKLNVKAVFDFTQATDADTKLNNGIYALATGSAAVVAYEPVVAEEEEVEVVYVGFNDSKSMFAMGEGANTALNLAADATVTNVKINGVECQYTVNAGWVCVTWSAFTSAGGTKPADNIYVMTAVIDGVTYSGTYDAN